MSTIYVIMFFLFFMFSLLISVSHRQIRDLEICLCIADLLHYLHEFSLHSSTVSFPSFRRRRRSIYSFMRADLLRVCIRKWGPRQGTAGRLSPHFITERSFDSMYSPYTYRMQTCARLLSAVFRAVSFRTSSRERSARSVASLALRRSPSYKTRSAGYTTRSRSYLADERRRKKEEGKRRMKKLICYSGTNYIEE